MRTKRLLAARTYAAALEGTGEPAEAVRLRWGILGVNTRASGPEERETLAAAVNLFGSRVRLGECAEAAALLRTTLAVWTRARGTDDEGTPATAVRALLRLGAFAEAAVVGRSALKKWRHGSRSRPLPNAHHGRQLGGIALKARQARESR